MLGGQRLTRLPDEIAPAPTTLQTVRAAFMKPLEEVDAIGDYIFPGLSTEQTRRESSERLSNINQMLGDTRIGFGQQAANFISGVAGSIAPTLPFAAVGAAAGAGIASAVGFGARGVALEAGESALAAYTASQVPLNRLATGAASHFLPKASLAKIGTTLATEYGAYKGFVIPENFVENYNAIENSLDTTHFIEDVGNDNYGFLLGALPILGGYALYKGVRGVASLRRARSESKALDAELSRLLKDHETVLSENKIREGETVKRQARVSELQDHLEEAVDRGLISEAMHDWYLDYLENPADKTKLHEDALKLMQETQIPYDRATGKVWNQVISRDGLQNFKNALMDEGMTNFTEQERQLLSSYVIHNELDGYMSMMRDNPSLLMAIKGATHIIGDRIARHSEALMNFEHQLTRVLDKGKTKRALFSQENIFNHLKKIKVSDFRHVPYHVPKQVVKKLKIHNKIKLIESQRSAKYRREFASGKHIDFQEKLNGIVFHTPKEEIKFLKDSLLKDGVLIDNYKTSDAYIRLQDLSQVWPNARHLLDRINLEATNAKQKGLNEALKKFVEMVDGNVARFANPDSVKRYLTERIERAVPSAREFEQLRNDIERNEIKIAEEKSIKSDEKQTILKMDEQELNAMRQSDYDYARQTFELAESKLKQLDEHQEAFNQLVSCALGEA